MVVNVNSAAEAAEPPWKICTRSF